MHRVLISLSSFGATEVRRQGQLPFARLAHAAGADGIEVRGELLTQPAAELPALAQAVRETRMDVVYSSPDGLWRADGALDHSALGRGLEAAAALGAPRLKMSLGSFATAQRGSVSELKERMGRSKIELLIENDQTAMAGTLAALQRFLAQAVEQDLQPAMTFDMGNWHWTGECPLQAAQALAGHVRYVHCKGVQRQPQRWIAVPLADSSAPWRAVLRALPRDVPWAIEYPLVGDDLLARAREEVDLLRTVAASEGAA